MSRSVSGMDHSVAYSCLLDLYPWYGAADTRDASHVTEHLVQVWRGSVTSGAKIGCYELAQQMEQELQHVLALALNARVYA